MADIELKGVDFDDESEDQDVAEQIPRGTVAAVVGANDWTTETIVSQLDRGNIQLNPTFQRRDAWRRDRKSRFIESLIVGLPIPQIVLAESKQERGKFIVIDGKQRLLAILQYWGHGEGSNNQYGLSGLSLRKDLRGKTLNELSTDDLNALANQSIRTVVIRNWRNSDFLHTVFLRLNTGSVMLSPQELRQALLPGPFSTYVDEASAKSNGLQTLLGLNEPDPRMRDIEILARFLAFHFFADKYPGRMKQFLDDAFDQFNKRWREIRPEVEEATIEFEAGVKSLVDVFDGDVARKPGSPQFNRAIFDALIYFHSQAGVRSALRGKNARVKAAYEKLFTEDTGFLQAVERDTAGAPNTATRLRSWAETLEKIAGARISAPEIPVATTSSSPAGARRKGRTKR